MGPRASWVSGDRSAGGGLCGPPEEEPPPRGRRGSGGGKGPQPEEEGARKDAPDGAAREACGSQRRGADARPSAGIMTRGGRTTPSPARPRAAPLAQVRRAGAGQWAGPG